MTESNDQHFPSKCLLSVRSSFSRIVLNSKKLFSDQKGKEFRKECENETQSQFVYAKCAPLIEKYANSKHEQILPRLET